MYQGSWLRSSARVGPEVIARHLLGAGEANDAAPLLLEAAELAPVADLPDGRVEYGALIPRKLALLERAAERFSHAAGADERARVGMHDP